MDDTAAREALLSIVRGEAPLSMLEEIGIHITWGSNWFRQEPVKESRCVTPSPEDIVHGLRAYDARPDELRKWAFFLEGTSSVDFAAFEEHPRGEELLDALWDASFGQEFDRGVLSGWEEGADQ